MIKRTDYEIFQILEDYYKNLNLMNNNSPTYQIILRDIIELKWVLGIDDK